MKHKDRYLKKTEDLYFGMCEQIQKSAMMPINFVNTCDNNSPRLGLNIKIKLI